MSHNTGITEKVRELLEQNQRKKYDVDMLVTALALKKKQPIYNALHELVKSGEIFRERKAAGKGSWHWIDDTKEPMPPEITQPAPNPTTPGEQLQNLLRQKLTAAPAKPPQPEPARALDRQEGGNHYKNCKIQPIEFITANGIGFCEGCAIKYLVRWRQKNGIEDLKKARHYIDLLIEFEERNP